MIIYVYKYLKEHRNYFWNRMGLERGEEETGSDLSPVIFNVSSKSPGDIKKRKKISVDWKIEKIGMFLCFVCNTGILTDSEEYIRRIAGKWKFFENYYKMVKRHLRIIMIIIYKYNSNKYKNISKPKSSIDYIDIEQQIALIIFHINSNMCSKIDLP